MTPKEKAIFHEQALATWNTNKHASWTEHRTLSRRAQAALRALHQELGGDSSKTLEALSQAVREAASDPYWQKIEGLTFENLASNGKLGTLADKYRSKQTRRAAAIQAEQVERTPVGFDENFEPVYED